MIWRVVSGRVVIESVLKEEPSFEITANLREKESWTWQSVI